MTFENGSPRSPVLTIDPHNDVLWAHVRRGLYLCRFQVLIRRRSCQTYNDILEANGFGAGVF